MNDLPTVPLMGGPTPIHELPRLSRSLGGPRLLVKRDDLTTLALGGNKTRKLEYLIADALGKGADTVITAGGIQSNHCRLTAAACAIHGLQCELVLGASQPSSLPTGNLFLDQLFGATVHWCERSRREATMTQLAANLRAAGRRPYVIPVGGSNGLGAVGYVRAMQELAEQLDHANDRVDHIVVASSSGGTQAGLVVGARCADFDGRVLGVSIDQQESGGHFPRELSAIANDAAVCLGTEERFAPADFDLEYGFLGGGYGVVGPLERDAINRAARLEGLLVGPVYTGRALGAMLAMIAEGRFGAGETVLYWHTGDTPTLFAYGAQLSSACR